MIKLILSTFFLVFLAELGDKTQLTTMLLSTQSQSKVAVFIGASTALILSSLLGIILGSTINKYISTHLLQITSGIAFIIIGIMLLFNKI